MKTLHIAGIVFLLALAVHSIPALTTPSPMGIDTYYFLRIGSLMKDSGFNLQHDPLSFGGRAFNYPSGLPLALGALALFSDISTTGIALAVIIGALSSVLVFLISLELLKNEKRKTRLAFASALLFAFVPVVVWRTSGAIINMNFELFFFLMSLYLLLGKMKELFVIPALALVLFSPAFGIIISVISLAYVRSKKRIFCIASVGVLLLSLANASLYYSSFRSIYLAKSLPVQIYNAIYPPVTLDAILYRLDPAVFALGIASVVLVIMNSRKGVQWRDEKNKLVVIILSCAFFAALITGLVEMDRASFYLSFPLCIGACYALSLIKNERLFTAMLVLLLAFAAADGALVAADLGYVTPWKEDMAALSSLKSTPNDTILSSAVSGHLVSYVTGSKNVMDGNLIDAPDINGRFSDAWAAYTTSDNAQRAQILEKYNVTYIFLSHWEREQFDANQTALDADPYLSVAVKFNDTVIYRRAA